jgi:general stress protein YciG
VSENRRTSNRGFASMDRETQRRIASKGGRSVPSEKRSFSMNRKLAAEAGRKGGQASHGSATDESRDESATPPPDSNEVEKHTEQ